MNYASLLMLCVTNNRLLNDFVDSVQTRLKKKTRFEITHRKVRERVYVV